MNKKEDLTWLVGPVFVGFALVAAFYFCVGFLGLSETVSVVLIYLVWAMVFDGTHAFATYSRTIFDRDFRSKNRDLLRRSTHVFIIGPALIGVSLLLFGGGVETASTTFIVFNRFALFYAFYHLVRQHWGFLAIYRKKAGDTDRTTRILDGMLLSFGTLYPLVSGSQSRDIEKVHVAETLGVARSDWVNTGTMFLVLGVSMVALMLLVKGKRLLSEPGKIGLSLVVSGLAVFMVLGLGIESIVRSLGVLFLACFVVTVGYYLYYCRDRLSIRALATPKWVLLFTVVASYNILFRLDVPILILIAAITVFHNIQYHKIVRYYNMNLYMGSDSSKYGLAVKLTQSLGLFLGVALLYNLFSYVPRIGVGLLDGELLIANYFMSSFFWGMAFHHYYLDSVIWRFRGNKSLNTTLKVTT